MSASGAPWLMTPQGKAQKQRQPTCQVRVSRFYQSCLSRSQWALPDLTRELQISVPADKAIPDWYLKDLVDRASTKGKAQQPVLLGLIYKGHQEHLRLSAGGSDSAQLKAAVKRVVTTSEKHAIIRHQCHMGQQDSDRP